MKALISFALTLLLTTAVVGKMVHIGFGVLLSPWVAALIAFILLVVVGAIARGVSEVVNRDPRDEY